MRPIKRKPTAPAPVQKPAEKPQFERNADCSICGYGEEVEFKHYKCSRPQNRQITPQPNVKNRGGICVYYQIVKKQP